MELVVVPRLLGLNKLETELFVGFLSFGAEPLERVAHLVRLRPDQVQSALPRLLASGVVRETSSDGRRLLGLADLAALHVLIEERAVVDGRDRSRLGLELELIAEIRAMGELRFINVVAIRERVGSIVPSPPIADYLRAYYPYADLRLGVRCNFNCLYCLLGHEKKVVRTMAAVRADLELGRRCGLRTVALTGGEPTLHPGLFEVIGMSRSLGYRNVMLVTNASTLAEERVVNRLADAGVTVFGVSFDAPDREVSEALWRRAAYDHVLRGLKNLVVRDDVDVGVIAVITRLNLHLLPDLARFLDEISRGGTGRFVTNLDFVMPEENAWAHRDAVVPAYHEVAGPLTAALEVARDTGLVLSYRGVPACVIGEQWLDLDLDRFMTIFQVHDHGSGREFNRSILDLYRTKPQGCSSCRHFRVCPGVYRSYAHLHGVEDLRPVV